MMPSLYIRSFILELDRFKKQTPIFNINRFNPILYELTLSTI